MWLQPSIEVPVTGPDDPRVGQLLRGQAGGEQPLRAVIAGFPTDVGVRRNGGRPGASSAPDRIRNFLYRMTPPAELAPSFSQLLSQTVDLGNFSVSDDLEADQQELGELLSRYLADETVVIVLGGGHETSFGHFLAYALNSTEVEILNFDAHADVRPLKDGHAHSGSPFRQALEHPSKACRRYTVLGLQPQSNAGTHLEFVREHGDYRWAADLNPQSISREFVGKSRLMVTIDVDVVDQAFAPGVSAPAVGGIEPSVLLASARQAGRSPRVTSIDVVEVNPQVDIADQTSRLAAVLVWQFLAGLAERP
ncbi:MAG: formimidoylglutamase [Acidobacteriota bacterium]|nr:MAG: formimidoylglutamase [Acidobacteriota bacterium]